MINKDIRITGVFGGVTQPAVNSGQMSEEMELMLKGYGLTTAQIMYRMPDHQSILQSYLWQQYDIAPDMPELRNFLDFWKEKLDGPLHSVQFVHRKLIQATEWRALKGEFVIH